MDIKFDKDSSGDAGSPNEQEGKGKQTIMLVVLVVLLCGFGYVYFFTGLIRPQEPPPSPPPQPQQVVKKPLPSREGVQPQAADKGATQPPKAAEPAKVAAAPVPKSATPVKPAEQKPVAAAKPAEQKPAPPPAKAEPPKPAQPQKLAQAPKAEPAKPETAGQPKAGQKPAVAAVKPEQKTAAKPEQKPSAKLDATKTATAAKADEKVPAPKVAAVKKGGPWTLVVGSYVLEEKLAEEMTKVKGQGLSAAITAGGRRSTVMYRLFYNTMTDPVAAQQAIDQLKKKSASAFSIQKGNNYTVMAGSYSMQERAVQEQQRLAAAGVQVTIQKTTVSIPTRKLTAGTFTDRASAESALKKLKKAGIGNPVLE